MTLITLQCQSLEASKQLLPVRGIGSQLSAQPGWAAIVPIYNYYIMLKVVGRPGWWIILLFIPIVNFVVALIVTYDLAKVFGKGMGYFLGLLFLGFIFYPMLGFGGAQYRGSSA